MIKFVQLSDLHIHGSNKKNDNVNTQKIVNYIGEKYSGLKKKDKPVVLITGDITDDGKKSQYKNAVKLIQPLVDAGFKVLACPGNHDYGLAGNFYTEKSQQRFQDYILADLLGIKKAGRSDVKMEKIYPTVDKINGSLFIGVDSVVGNEDELLHFASGEVGKEQRKKLAAILTDPVHSKKQKIVYLHHHPFYRNILKKIVLELDDAKKVMRILGGRVDFLCFGHKHVSDVWPAEHGIDWILASGKSTERNDRYKFQFREVTIDGDDNNVSIVTFRRD